MLKIKNKMIFWVLYCYYLLLRKTCRFEGVHLENLMSAFHNASGAIISVAHQSLLATVLFFDGLPATLLASLSKDGEIIANVLKARGFDVVRGSSSKGGSLALAELHKALAEGSVLGITIDGPRGPPCVPKLGTSLLAYEQKKPVYFIEIHPKCGGVLAKLGIPGFVRMGSWDKFLLPLPFGHFSVTAHALGLQVSTEVEGSAALGAAAALGATTAEAMKRATEDQSAEEEMTDEEKKKFAWCFVFNQELQAKATAAYGALYVTDKLK